MKDFLLAQGEGDRQSIGRTASFRILHRDEEVDDQEEECLFGFMVERAVRALSVTS